MQQIYNLEIDGREIYVNSELGEAYHVSVDGHYLGSIFPVFDDNLGHGGLIWCTEDLISDELVRKIGLHIEDQDM